jgi:N-hydroxyarylamine O-acetyltransferase
VWRGSPGASEPTGFPSTTWRCGSTWTSRGSPTSDSAISFLLPLRLEAREPQQGGCGRRYRLDAADGGLLLMREEAEGWQRQYLFTLETWPLSAFEDGCRHHRTSPESHFTRKTVVSRATETGRITLSERRLIVTSSGMRTETVLGDDAAISRVLVEQFGIEDPDPVSGRRIGG